MQVTEVRIKLMEQSEDRLRAFCSITIDHSFVVRDLKIIEGSSGPFVAMPSRKLSGHCPRCGYKNHLRAAYCNQCGVKLRLLNTIDSPQKLYADVAHPINSECREMISAAVLMEFDAELKRAAEPGYRSRYDDEFDAIAESDDDTFARIDPQAPSHGSHGNHARDDPQPSPIEQASSPPQPHLAQSSDRGDSTQTSSAQISSEQTSREQTSSEQTDSSEATKPSDQSFGAGIFE